MSVYSRLKLSALNSALLRNILTPVLGPYWWLTEGQEYRIIESYAPTYTDKLAAFEEFRSTMKHKYPEKYLENLHWIPGDNYKTDPLGQKAYVGVKFIYRGI